MNAQPPKYESLALDLQDLIERHEYPAGYKLPSIRRLSEQWGCSIETVQRALNLLEDRGYTQPVPKSGVFVIERPRDTQPACHDPTEDWVGEDPVELQLADQISSVIKQCVLPGVARLGVAFPSPELLPIAGLRRSYLQATREYPDLLHQGSHVHLSLDALTQVLHHRFERSGLKIKPNEILITEGCTSALSLALQTVTKPGDVVAVESPGYYLLLQMIEKLGLKALEIPCGEQGFCVNSLEIALQRNSIKAAIVCPTASNPSGSVMPAEKRQKLIDLSNQHDIVLIEDCVYYDLYWERYQPKPIKSFKGANQVIMCGSFSKSLSPSLRMGYVVGGKFSESLHVNQRILIGSSNPVTQMALALYLTGNRYDRHIRTLKRQFETQVNMMSALIYKHFPEGTRISKPQGGFVIWVELPRQFRTDKLFKKAINLGTSFMPGCYFSASGLYANFMRINCGNPVTSDIEIAVKKLGQLLHESSRLY